MKKEETWRPIIGYEGLYEISSFGRIKKKYFTPNYNGIVYKNPSINKTTGYYMMTLHKDGKPHQHTLHRLIAIHFIPNPNNYYCVNHKDGNKLNNALDNLEWTTLAENNRHAIKSGLKKKIGEHHPDAKLTKANVIAIKQKLKYGVNANVLAKEYNVSAATIFNIKANRIWKTAQN